jgi:hypothetical protein
LRTWCNQGRSRETPSAVNSSPEVWIAYVLALPILSSSCPGTPRPFRCGVWGLGGGSRFPTPLPSLLPRGGSFWLWAPGGVGCFPSSSHTPTQGVGGFQCAHIDAPIDYRKPLPCSCLQTFRCMQAEQTMLCPAKHAFTVPFRSNPFRLASAWAPIQARRGQSHAQNPYIPTKPLPDPVPCGRACWGTQCERGRSWGALAVTPLALGAGDLARTSVSRLQVPPARPGVTESDKGLVGI